MSQSCGNSEDSFPCFAWERHAATLRVAEAGSTTDIPKEYADTGLQGVVRRARNEMSSRRSVMNTPARLW